MLHGNISNEVEGSIAFRVDGFLFREKKKSFFQYLTNGSTRVAFEIDNTVRKAINSVYFYTPHTVDLVCKLYGAHEERFKEELEELLDAYDIPYGRIFIVKKDTEILNLLTSAYFQYYIDDVDEHIEQVSSEYCMDISTLYSMIARRERRGKRL